MQNNFAYGNSLHTKDGDQPKEAETKPFHETSVRKNTGWGTVYTDLNNVVLPTDSLRTPSRLLKETCEIHNKQIRDITTRMLQFRQLCSYKDSEVSYISFFKMETDSVLS